MTQFGRALGSLNIDILCANTPAVKGRVERAPLTLRERLVKERRLRRIRAVETANAFAPEFMADCNRRFARAAGDGLPQGSRRAVGRSRREQAPFGCAAVHPRAAARVHRSLVHETVQDPARCPSATSRNAAEDRNGRLPSGLSVRHGPRRTGHLYLGGNRASVLWATQKPRFFRQSAYPLVAPVGCGAHRITHVKPSMRDEGSHVVQRTHAHGTGPLLVGGGGFFRVLNEMSPALVDYTGPVRTADVWPDGFAEVSTNTTSARACWPGSSPGSSS